MGKVIALCGGVGGAKLALGLSRLLAPEQLTVAVNTGDDFEHLGLPISPDIDTVLYTLSGRNNQQLGWGVTNESWNAMEQLALLGGETWFKLGDRDLALHLQRRTRLAQDATLTQVTRELASVLGIGYDVIPMSDAPVRTVVTTTEHGELPFQHYFVKHQCQPTVSGIQYRHADQAAINPALQQALTDPNLSHIIICPSNPLLSIAPILALPRMREQLVQRREKVRVVSPLIGGQAIKGPTAKIMQELAIPTTSSSIADFYRDLLGTLIIDTSDAHDAEALRAQGINVICCNTLMKTDADKIALAQQVIA